MPGLADAETLGGLSSDQDLISGGAAIRKIQAKSCVGTSGRAAYMCHTFQLYRACSLAAPGTSHT